MRLTRFIFVGGFCALLNSVAVIVLVRNGMESVTASLVAFGPVLLIGYACHALFTFGTEPSRQSFTRYTVAVAANFPIWIAALYLLCDVLKISIAVAAPVTTVVIFLWNYGSAHWAFVRRARPAAPVSGD